ncbi:unnamed protein product [Larinioides sclopetarius]|uniref:Uncharacterized protein n=1 Tax=Larinioides sclopetarius TaxID=280406 RepID=A0AAV2APU8_9ARAC
MSDIFQTRVPFGSPALPFPEEMNF